MMSEWKSLTIGDICCTVSNTYKGKDEKVVLVNTSDVLDGKILNHSLVDNINLKGQFKKTFHRNDILYSEIRPANKRFAFVDFDDTSLYIASTKLMVIRPYTEKVLPEFLFAILKSQNVIDELQHLAETRSGTFPQITFTSELSPMPIMLPDLQTQEKIVSVLSSIENKIELNRRINKNLSSKTQNLFFSAARSAPFVRKQRQLPIQRNSPHQSRSRQGDFLQQVYVCRGCAKALRPLEQPFAA